MSWVLSVQTALCFIQLCFSHDRCLSHSLKNIQGEEQNVQLVASEYRILFITVFWMRLHTPDKLYPLCEEAVLLTSRLGFTPWYAHLAMRPFTDRCVPFLPQWDSIKVEQHLNDKQGKQTLLGAWVVWTVFKLLIKKKNCHKKNLKSKTSRRAEDSNLLFEKKLTL